MIKNRLHRLGDQPEQVGVQRAIPVSLKRHARREVLANARVHPRAIRQSPRGDAVRGGAVRVEVGGVLAEHRRVAVDRQQVDDELVALRNRAARLEVDIAQHPTHRRRTRRLQPNRLVGAALHEQPVGGHPLGVFGMSFQPLEDVVRDASKRRGRRVRAGQQIEGDLTHDDIARQVEVVVVRQQHAEHVVRGTISRSYPAGDRRLDELGGKGGEFVGHLGTFGITVPGVVRQRRSLDEPHEIVVEPERLVGSAERTVDTCGLRSEVHHHLVTELDQLSVPTGNVRGDRRGDHRGEEFTFVDIDDRAAEQPVFKAPAGAMVVAMEVDKHVGHDHFTRVVERLAQVFLAICVAGLVVAGDRMHGWLAHRFPCLSPAPAGLRVRNAKGEATVDGDDPAGGPLGTRNVFDRFGNLVHGADPPERVSAGQTLQPGERGLIVEQTGPLVDLGEHRTRPDA